MAQEDFLALIVEALREPDSVLARSMGKWADKHEHLLNDPAVEAADLIQELCALAIEELHSLNQALSEQGEGFAWGRLKSLAREGILHRYYQTWKAETTEATFGGWVSIERVFGGTNPGWVKPDERMRDITEHLSEAIDAAIALGGSLIQLRHLLYVDGDFEAKHRKALLRHAERNLTDEDVEYMRTVRAAACSKGGSDRLRSTPAHVAIPVSTVEWTGGRYRLRPGILLDEEVAVLERWCAGKSIPTQKERELRRTALDKLLTYRPYRPGRPSIDAEGFVEPVYGC